VDHLEAFADAAYLFDSRVQATPAAAWGDASPCEGWTARDVVAHVAGNLRGLRAALDGGDFAEAAGRPLDADPAEVWATEVAGLDALVKKAEGAAMLTLRGREMPVGLLLDALMRDMVVHTWDLARAVGGDEHLPEDLVDAATTAMGLVTEQMRRPGLYGPAVEAPAGADAQTRLLALSGRRTA
jgi:uncharacterized protein (TIGR03086 family)